MINTPKYWENRNWQSNMMLPFSWIYFIISGLNRWLYKKKIRRQTEISIPIIVVGNIISGGTGKTPTTIELANFFKKKNINCGIISRGYKSNLSNNKTSIEVTTDSLATNVGDEPLLIKYKTNVPVFISTNKTLACQQLLTKYPKTQVIISDDGLQHYALKRDLEICIFDDRSLGNNRLLPAGPLRERWPHNSIEKCPLMILFTETNCTYKKFNNAFIAKRSLAKNYTNGLQQNINITELAKQPIQALAGIARPEKFFSFLQKEGFYIKNRYTKPDHYQFNETDILKLQLNSEPIVCTEKDAMKIWPLFPYAWAAPMEIQIEQQFFNTIWQHLLNNPKFNIYN